MKLFQLAYIVFLFVSLYKLVSFTMNVNDIYIILFIVLLLWLFFCFMSKQKQEERSGGGGIEIKTQMNK